jgi:hypothetical protein
MFTCESDIFLERHSDCHSYIGSWEGNVSLPVELSILSLLKFKLTIERFPVERLHGSQLRELNVKLGPIWVELIITFFVNFLPPSLVPWDCWPLPLQTDFNWPCTSTCDSQHSIWDSISQSMVYVPTPEWSLEPAFNVQLLDHAV